MGKHPCPRHRRLAVVGGREWKERHDQQFLPVLPDAAEPGREQGERYAPGERNERCEQRAGHGDAPIKQQPEQYRAGKRGERTAFKG